MLPPSRLPCPLPRVLCSTIETYALSIQNLGLEWPRMCGEHRQTMQRTACAQLLKPLIQPSLGHNTIQISSTCYHPGAASQNRLLVGLTPAQQLFLVSS